MLDEAVPSPTPPRAPGGRSRPSRAARTEVLLCRLAGTSPPERDDLLEELVTLNMGVADAVVSRYRNRGVAVEDLRQVAYMALVRAAHRFDTDSGNDFLSYAVPTMRGEIRRYFRDQGWMVRPPRRVQELQQRLQQVSAVLQRQLGRDATPSELAAETGESLTDVTEALRGEGCFSPASLDRPVGDGEEADTLGDLLSDPEADLAPAEARLLLGPAVRRLAERDRRILMLRFFGGLTQQEIAEDIGVTQMQVSRLLHRILTGLRADLGGEPASA